MNWRRISGEMVLQGLIVNMSVLINEIDGRQS